MATQPFSLDLIDVASPCKADWARMTGDERVRHCARCDKKVYNLSGMTREAAEELVLANEGICGRFFRRSDGTILTADCPVGWWDARWHFARVSALAASLLGLLTFGLVTWAVGGQQDEVHRETQQNPFARLSDEMSPTLGPVAGLLVMPGAPPQVNRSPEIIQTFDAPTNP